jgi:hypothetical protein
MGELTDPDQIIEDALSTHPLSPAPPTLAPAVMARVRTLAPLPRFRLSWVDGLVSFFIAGMTGLTVLLWQLLPPQLALQTRLQFMYLLQRVNLTVLQGALLGGAALAMLAVLVAVIVFGRARSSPTS